MMVLFGKGCPLQAKSVEHRHLINSSPPTKLDNMTKSIMQFLTVDYVGEPIDSP